MKKNESKNAVSYLCDIFRSVEPENEFMVKLGGAGEKKKTIEMMSKVTIAGFSEERRKKRGRLDKLASREGAVFLYGDNQPDFFLIINNGEKPIVFPLERAKASRSGFADGILHVESPDWKKAPWIEINIANAFSGQDAIAFFTKTLLERINHGEYAARLGKWISKKVFDRDMGRDEAETLSAEEEIRNPGNEVIRTMVIGSDIGAIHYVHEKKSTDGFKVLTVKQSVNTTKMPFRSMVVEFDTLGKEIGARRSKSSYVYLIGVPFNAPANLIIIRHRSKEAKQSNQS